MDAAVSAARRASSLVGGLAPVLRWKKGLLRPTGDGDSGVVSSKVTAAVACLLCVTGGREGEAW